MKNSVLYNDIGKAIEYIEENLANEISLDKISTHVNISKFHLNRLFHSMVGTPLMSYVKKRKLSSSLSKLLNTGLKISDIAHDYGFSYEQSYIRSFINTFGISPNRFRKEKPIMNIQDKINLEYINAVGDEGLALAPQIVIIPEFYITGIRYKINKKEDRLHHEANKKGNEFFDNCIPLIENVINPDIYIGLVEYVDEIADYTFYTPSVQVSSPGRLPQDMIYKKIQTNKYAVFKYVGLHNIRHTNINNLTDTIGYIYKNWFAKSGYYRSDLYHFERIDEKYSKQDYCELQICVPVSDRTAET
jgi:AraC family transcriptional regulator